jgi:hypothetical protein
VSRHLRARAVAVVSVPADRSDPRKLAEEAKIAFPSEAMGHGWIHDLARELLAALDREAALLDVVEAAEAISGRDPSAVKEKHIDALDAALSRLADRGWRGREKRLREAGNALLVQLRGILYDTDLYNSNEMQRAIDGWEEAI